MSRVILPESKLKARRRRQRILVAIFSGISILILFGASVWLAHASFLRITDIQITGNTTLASTTLQKEVQEKISGSYLYLFPKNNIFLYGKKAIATTLVADHPSIKDIQVTAENFHTLRIVLVERVPVALWCGESIEVPQPCMFLDAAGVVYAPAPEFSVPIYIQYYGMLSTTTTPSTYLTGAQFGGLEALVGELVKTEASDSLRTVYIDSEKDVHISYASGFTLLFDLESSGGNILERFSLAMTAAPFTTHALSEFEYLDLRFGTKLYYKLK